MKKKLLATHLLIATLLLSGCGGVDNTEAIETKIETQSKELNKESTKEVVEGKDVDFESMSFEELKALTFEELGEEGLRIMIEKDPDYSPLTDEELETYELGPETYGDDGSLSYMYFSHQPETKINKLRWLPQHTGGSDKFSMLGQLQTFLITEGYGDAEELNVVIGSEVKDDKTASFDITMTAYPDVVVKVVYYIETGEFGFEW